MKKVNKWIGISGSWRKTNKQIEKDVRDNVRNIILEGNGIVTGGALNVDYQATDEILKLNRVKQLKIYLPTTLSIYTAHYRKRAEEGVITQKQAKDLISQLTKVKKLNANSLIENPNNNIVDKETYYERNQKVIEESDELLAFHVNKSAGVQDTIDKAKKKGIPVKILSYDITE